MIWLPVVGSYADADVYASILAYTDLLNQRGKKAKAYIPFAPNYSVPDELRLKDLEGKTFDFTPEDEAIILDVSVPDAINKFVPTNQILELIDHHAGYEKYWQERLGERAIIEKLGAVATSIFEWWGECWDYKKMSPEIAKLLLIAILDNTLNFKSENTTERDHKASTELAKIIGTNLPDFTKWYFSSVSRTVMENFEESLLGDSKMVKWLPGEQLGFGQITLWDAKDAEWLGSKINDVMNKKYQKWVVSVISIAEDKNYIFASAKDILEYFAKLLDLRIENGLSSSVKLYLRKEIIAKMLECPPNDSLTTPTIYSN